MRPPQGQLTFPVRPMTREDYRGPAPVPFSREELAVMQWQAAEAARKKKAGLVDPQPTNPKSGRTLLSCMCCVAGFEIGWMCVVIIFMLDHERFCDGYWENTNEDGVYTIGNDEYWPELNGQPKTYLWAWVHLIVLGVNCIINLSALTSHVICSRSVDNTCHAFMQYAVTITHLITGSFGLAWSIVGALWVFGDKVIPQECKDGDVGNNDYYIFLMTMVIMSLVSWPCFCLTLMFKSRVWWHDPVEGDRLMTDHYNRPTKPEVNPEDDFQKFGYMA